MNNIRLRGPLGMSCIGEISPVRETLPELELSILDARTKDSAPGPATVGGSAGSGGSAIAGGQHKRDKRTTGSRNPVQATGDTRFVLMK